MFCTVLEDKEKCREFLERVLGKKIAKLELSQKQRVIDVRYESKGIRLDVYVEDTDGNVYDIEMQTVKIGDIGKRSRYYHSEMDSYQIRRVQSIRN